MRVVVADVAAVVGATALAHAQLDGEAVLAAACKAHADARAAAAVGALLRPGVLARLQADGVVGGQVDGVARGDGGADGADVRLRLAAGGHDVDVVRPDDARAHRFAGLRRALALALVAADVDAHLVAQA